MFVKYNQGAIVSVLVPGFAERVFEFAFNAEYAHRNQALLTGSPNIPSQNEEAWLGYDVEFSIIASGGATHTVALQHKVSRYVDNWSRSNDHFWTAAGGPYYAFRLDVDQYNLIHWLAGLGLPHAEIHYCAPLFATRADMDTHYLGTAVETNSVWIDVQGSGALNTYETHTIIYDAAGANAFVFSSDAQKLSVVSTDVRRARSEERRQRRVDFTKLERELRRALRAYWVEKLPQQRRRNQLNQFSLPSEPPPDEPPEDEASAKTVSALIADFVGLDVMIETAKPVVLVDK
jgi:hypothetical protein